MHMYFTCLFFAAPGLMCRSGQYGALKNDVNVTGVILHPIFSLIEKSFSSFEHLSFTLLGIFELRKE